MNSAGHAPVLILGAGLTGLSTAVHLRERSIPFRIVERAGEVGGHATTHAEHGFRFDRTGHLLHLRDEPLITRVRGWLGDEVVELARQSRVWSHGVLTRYPFQANAYGLPPRIAFECVMGFLAAQRACHQSPPKNFADFCRQHFGSGISERFMIPYNERLWGVSAEEITSDWCQRFVPIPSPEDVIAGAVGLVDRELGYNARFLYPRRGIGALAAAMHRELGGVAELNQAPLRVDLVHREVHLPTGVVGYDVLVSTIPLPALVPLVDAVPEAVRAAASALRATPLYYLDVAVDAPAGAPYHWVYLPESHYPFYRVGCYSNFSAEMAPAGKSNYYVELVDRAPPDLDRLLPQVASGLREMGFLGPTGAIAFVRARRLDPAYVVFDRRCFAATEEVQAFLRERRVVSTGRYGGWNYSSMEDALAFGRDAARRAAEVLDD
ncbi:MAG: FAD-dependent oxidoreductase [Polyangiaceae bacterium]|nr:FAD-dependent oxidoreductase [Polyangiaceae bacterium]